MGPISALDSAFQFYILKPPKVTSPTCLINLVYRIQNKKAVVNVFLLYVQTIHPYGMIHQQDP